MLDAQEVFLPRTPGRLKGVVSGRRLRPSEIAYVTVGLDETGDRQTIYVARVALLDGEPQYSVAAAPVVDTLGQWTARAWPGKTADETALRRQLEASATESSAAAFPAGWCRWGASEAKRFRASGYFRTEREAGRWWFVDPHGHAFWSAGLDGARPGESMAVLPGTDALCRWLPPAEGQYAPAWERRGSAQRLLMFGVSNLIRVFGSRWHERWIELTRGRLVAWRFNTIGNWSDPELIRRADLPYVTQLGGYPSTPILLFRDFPDVFDPAFRAAAARYAAPAAERRDDARLVGYFMNNEPKWGFGGNNLASEMLEANPGSQTRRRLSEWLRERYRNDAVAWSKAWGAGLSSFAQVETDILRRAADTSADASEDLWSFSREMVRAYVGIPAEELRKADPNHLNLGLRYASISSDLFYTAGEFFDVFSINSYRMEPPADVVRTIAERTGKPVLIGEFHFGALDRGLPATGLRGVASQTERGVAYRRYLELAAADPNLVGAHYFILNDQALLGRFDGENYQIGFVDVCHTPYAELVDAARRAHEGVYEVRCGSRPPYAGRAREVPRIK
jgi:hypothetical protein